MEKKRLIRLIKAISRVFPENLDICRIVTDNDVNYEKIPLLVIDENFVFSGSKSSVYIIKYDFKTDNPYQSKGYRELYRLLTGFYEKPLIIIEIIKNENQGRFIPRPDLIYMHFKGDDINVSTS